MPSKQPKLAKQDKRVEELTADLQRLQADFVNYKTRADKERAEALKLGRELAVTELLQVFDNLERAFAHTPEDIQDHNWVKGINGLEKQLQAVLGELGLEKITTTGKEFNPMTMEAVSHEGEGEIVTEELRSGYMLDGKVVRPAMVKVG